MLVEILLAVLIVTGCALAWHVWTRPEHILERFMRSLDMPAYRFQDCTEPAQRLTLVGDELALRYYQVCEAGRRFCVDAIEDIARRAEVYERFLRAELGNPSADTLDSIYDDVFFDLQYGAIAADTTERFFALEDRIVGLIADLRLLKKLEHAFMGTA